MRPVLALIGALVGLVVLTACSASSQTAAAPQPAAAPSSTAAAQMVSLQASDTLKFDPASLTVQAGQPVQLTLANTGQTQHDWSLDQGAAQPVKIVANAGQSATGTFIIERPGTYTFICSVPGHAAAGMQGTITAR